MRLTLAEWCAARGDDTLLRDWDAEKNADLTPKNVSYGSKKKPFWRCARGHSWQATVCSRTAGAGCPCCAGKKPADGGSLAARYPELAGEWHPTKNAALTPADVTPGTHRKAWWRCKAAGHEWQAEIKSRTEGSGCPYCTNRAVLPGYNDLATTHPNLAAEWDTIENKELTPADVTAGTDRRVWWRCRENPNHKWRSAVSSRSHGQGCPYCAGKQVLAGENDLASRYPQIAAEWDAKRNGALEPRELMPSSNKKVYWLCPLGHSYAAAVADRTARSRGCPYCAGRRVLPGFNDLATRDPRLAAQWYQALNASLTPEQVTCGSSKKVYWRCAEGHVWPAVISSRATGRKCGCPVCAGRTKVSFAARYQTSANRETPYSRTATVGMEAMGK